MAWISKKAKAQMRMRKKRMEKSETDSNKRKLEHVEEEVESSKICEVKKVDAFQTVTIPSTLTSKEASKLRKDARRAARKEEKDENLIKFVDENGDPLLVKKDESSKSKKDADDAEEEEESSKEPLAKKRKKKSFHNINELLAEAKAAKQILLEKEKRDAYDNSIPDEVKASYVALDCEMVGVGADGKQSALARVSVTGWQDEIILDTFVQVPDRVTDFRTHVSGVRAKDIRFTNHNAMELHACRKKVGQILQNKILVGHSLKNDFAALMLDHPKSQIRDTARYKPFMRASGRNGGKLRPRKLRDLVKENLDLIIQKEGQEGNGALQQLGGIIPR
jgi:RNA exonuclease 4